MKFITKNTVLSDERSELDRLLNYYKSIGYYDVQIVSSSKINENNETVLTYNINVATDIVKIITNIGQVLIKK